MNSMNGKFGQGYMSQTGDTYWKASDALLDPNHDTNPNQANIITLLRDARDTYVAACNFLAQNHVVTGNTDVNNFQKMVGVESFNSEFSQGRLGDSEIYELVRRARVPASLESEAVDAVRSFLGKVTAAGGNNELFRNQHFLRGSQAGRSKLVEGAALQHTVNVAYAPSLSPMYNNFGVPEFFDRSFYSAMAGQEAFGANIDTVLPDIRASLAVTLMQFHRGILDRIMHRRTSASPYVKYVVPYAEAYDMLKSNDRDAQVRNEGDHIVPLIELYADPQVVSNTLQQIVPLKSNDTNDDLVSDNVIKFNRNVNLFDLSVRANQLGGSHYNYTDLVSENVSVQTVYIKLKKDATEETFAIDVGYANGARLNMMPNVEDSGIRATFFTHTVKLTKDTQTVEGQPSTILASCTNDDYIRVDINITASINLKYANANGMAHATVRAMNRNRSSVDPTVESLATELKKEGGTTLVGYTLNAQYSEENLRKSNLALRYHIRTFDFEISNGRNILVDYSFQEDLPEFVMSLITEATSLGQDHRGVDVITRQMMWVYDQTNQENMDPTFRDRLKRIGFQYVASQLVRPVVYLNTIDLNNVDNIRSGDILGDIRSYVELELLNLTSLYFQNSFYRTQLAPGESPVFKVLTSDVIMDNLLSIPHYHDHLNKDDATGDSDVQFRRVLPNGAILEVVTTAFNYWRDKIVMIPYRKDKPDDILNWGHNYDCGTFVAYYNPQLGNGVNKRVFANARTMVIPTNPSGIYLDVKNASKLINLFTVTNPHVNGSTVPQPSDELVELP